MISAYTLAAPAPFWPSEAITSSVDSICKSSTIRTIIEKELSSSSNQRSRARCRNCAKQEQRIQELLRKLSEYAAYADNARTDEALLQDLRKQLAAYAVEIEELREDNSRLMNMQELTCLGSHARESQKCLRENKRLTSAQHMDKIGSEDLRKQLSAYALEIDELRIANREQQELRKQLAAYALEIDELREEKIGLEHVVQDVQDLAQCMAEAQQAISSELSTQSPQAPNTADCCEAASVEMSSQSPRADDITDCYGAISGDLSQQSPQAKEPSIAIEEVRDIVGTLQATLVATQEKFVAQTVEFAQFVATVKQEQVEAQNELEHAKKLFVSLNVGEYVSRHNHDSALSDLQKEFERSETLHAAREEELCKIVAANEQRVQQSHEKNRRPTHGRVRTLGQSILNSCLHQMLHEMKIAQQGVELEKITRGHHYRQMALVVRTPEELTLKWSRPAQLRTVALFPKEMALKWRKVPSKDWSTTLHLRDIIQIEYGCTFNASFSSNKIKPWLCFSLYTTHRSYDFFCPGRAHASVPAPDGQLCPT